MTQGDYDVTGPLDCWKATESNLTYLCYAYNGMNVKYHNIKYTEVMRKTWLSWCIIWAWSDNRNPNFKANYWGIHIGWRTFVDFMHPECGLSPHNSDFDRFGRLFVREVWILAPSRLFTFVSMGIASSAILDSDSFWLSNGMDTGGSGRGLGFRPSIGRLPSMKPSRKCAILHEFQL